MRPATWCISILNFLSRETNMTTTNRTMPLLTIAAVATAMFGLAATSANGQLIDNSGITAIASTEHTDRAPTNAVNGSGLTFNGAVGEENDPTKYQHQGLERLGKNDNWSSTNLSASTEWLIVDLGAVYALDQVSFFNFNPGLNDTGKPSGNDDHTDRGVATGKVWYRRTSETINTNGNGSAFNSAGYTQLGTTAAFTRAPGGPSVPHGAIPQTVPDTIAFGGASARYVAIEILTNQGDASFVGIGELQFFAGSPRGMLIYVK
jgi:hypothetical protein